MYIVALFSQPQRMYSGAYIYTHVQENTIVALLSFQWAADIWVREISKEVQLMTISGASGIMSTRSMSFVLMYTVTWPLSVTAKWYIYRVTV